MIGTLSQNLSDNLAGMAFFLALAFVVSWIAGAIGYYKLPDRDHPGPSILLQDVFASFLIFIVVYFLILPYSLFQLICSMPIEHRYSLNLLGHLLTVSITALLLFLYARSNNRKAMRKLWKDPTFPGNRTLPFDIQIGALSWIVAMPVVASTTYIVDILTSFLLQPTNKEQVAVQFLKDSLSDPLAAIVAFFSILVAAPLFEEYLFRGLLLSYIRTKLGPLAAITISAAIFGLFHFSPSQSVENIPLVLTLFVFGCYLGFVYEKTRSLLSSIVLHVTFNSISVIRIIFTDV